MAAEIDRAHLRGLMEQERERFVEAHPRSWEQHERSQRSMLGGVPMGWMTAFAGGFPIVVAEANGARLMDVDGNQYDDFFLGEAAAMSGHSPAPVVDALVRQADRGLATMLPSEDALWVSEELARRFGLPVWHFALSATDANRFAIRLAREVTGRQRLVLFGGYYHGTIDDAPGAWDIDRAYAAGSLEARATHAQRSYLVEYNDVAALEEALAGDDVACVLLEPAVLNVGIILPEPGFHAAVRELTRRHGTPLLIDETLGWSAGPGGCTRLWDLEPDILTIGKALGGGIPAAAYGFSQAFAAELEARGLAFCEGTGGTLAGNPLSAAAMRANLEHVLTDDAFAAMIALAGYAAARIDALIYDRGLPWHTAQLGCRLDYVFSAHPVTTAAASNAAMDDELSNFLRLWELNRGFVLAPFIGNVLLMSPATTQAQVDRYVATLVAALDALILAG